jgi:signal transduction histidine kinase
LSAARSGADLVTPEWLQRQINHDIQHELSTIILLASLLSSANDVGPDSRRRADQLLGETRWLHQLLRASENSTPVTDPPTGSALTSIRLDLVAAEVVAAVQLSTSTRICLDACQASAEVDRLAFWRVLRNLVGNAVRAAGSRGVVEVRIYSAGGWAVVQVDDNGPGFGAVPPGMASLGLGIAQDLVAACGGELEIRRRALGGCSVLVRLPSAAPKSTDNQGDVSCES